MVYGEEAVRSVLAAEDRLVASDWPQATSVLVGPDSLNLLSGQRHGAVKKALSEAFGERQMRRHVPRIAQIVQGYMERWARGPQPTPGFAACQDLSQAVFDAVVLGGDGGQPRAAELQSLTTRLQLGFQTPPVQLPFTDYGKAVAARDRFGAIVADAIAGCRSASAAPNCALADVVLGAAGAAAPGAPTPLPDSLIVDNMAAAFFGNASTGPSLSKALQHLAACPHVLDQLRREQQDLIARYGDAITADVVESMPYGSAVVKELLRITPAVPAVFRVAVVDFELQGRTIPKGWRVWCHLGDSVLKYNKDAFEPERWLAPSENASPPSLLPAAATGPDTTPTLPSSAAAAATHAPAAPGGGCPLHTRGGAAARPEYSLPFGSGVRTCLGRNLVLTELLVVLAVLARGYAWEAVTPGEEWRVVPAPAPKAGLLVNLRKLG